jgi:RHS repeat-associated protein
MGRRQNDAAAAPAYGRVAYAHGPGIDQPLIVVRIGYVPPSSIGAEADYQFNRWGGPWAVIPLTDYRGTPITGTVANGRRLPCETSSTCALVEWPTTYRAYYSERAPASQQAWFGSLVQNSSDGSGLMYRRNRYYNPATGLFTQPDPIGLAGGLNTYGFAEATRSNILIRTGFRLSRIVPPAQQHTRCSRSEPPCMTSETLELRHTGTRGAERLELNWV